MTRIRVEYFLAVDEEGHTIVDESATEATALLAERYETATSHVIKLTCHVPLPVIEQVTVDVPERAVQRTEIEAC